MAKELKHADKATQELFKKAQQESLQTVWDRYEEQQPQCGFGTLGLCCRHCSMGPCRIDPFGDGPKTGVCGADADTIAARGIARMIASGTAAHSDHGRDVAHTVLMVARDPNSDYGIKNEEKLKKIAEIYGIETSGKDIMKIAEEVALAALEEFGRQEGEVIMAGTAPAARVKLWKEQGLSLTPEQMGN